MAAPVPLKYRAFISYSHQDTTWAKWLQRGLEGFKIDKDLAGRETARGGIPESLRPIFRDREDFTAGEALPEQTLAALDASHALIVVCSPDSAKSNYVNEEARLYKLRHPDRPVIPLIVGGKPDDPERECFPPALKFKFDTKGRTTRRKAELLAADAREEGDGKDLALAKVIAGLLGLSSDEVFRRAERERKILSRRRRRLQALAISLLLLGGVGWHYQPYLLQQYEWYSKVWPYLLTPDNARALTSLSSFRECAFCPEMVKLSGGDFLMGSPEDEGMSKERPRHKVALGKPFAVSKYELTFEEYDACAETWACQPAPDEGWGRGRRPAINVNWQDAKNYANWLSNLTGKPYRLLSEAEWEYAARAGSLSSYSFGEAYSTAQEEGSIEEFAWFDDNSDLKTQEVGQKRPNSFNLYDMHGNASEWVEDCDHNSYEGAPADGSAWLGNDIDCSYRMHRGGSWLNDVFDLRSAARDSFLGGSLGYQKTVGFRIARDLDQ